MLILRLKRSVDREDAVAAATSNAVAAVLFTRVAWLG